MGQAIDVWYWGSATTSAARSKTTLGALYAFAAVQATPADAMSSTGMVALLVTRFRPPRFAA
jgi:hypothetical protein